MSQDKPVLSPREALADMFAMIDEGWLVRDISEDHKEGWAARQLKFVMRLAAAKAALAAPPHNDHEPPQASAGGSQPADESMERGGLQT